MTDIDIGFEVSRRARKAFGSDDPGYGVEYYRDHGTRLFAEMNGGWTAMQLRAIADDLDARAIEREERKKEKP